MTNESTVAVVEPRWQWRSFWWGVAGGLAVSWLIDLAGRGDRREYEDEDDDGEQDTSETEQGH